MTKTWPKEQHTTPEIQSNIWTHKNKKITHFGEAPFLP